MTLIELKNLLATKNVPLGWYSLDDGLKYDAYVIYKNYSIWECYYLDEKGNKSDFQLFDNEESAYDYLWKKMEYLLKFYKK